MGARTAAFNRLFPSDGHDSARDFSGGLRWDFPAADLNQSAEALFRQLDSIMHTLRTPAHVFLASVELDAEAGRFPDALLQYFRDVDADDRKTFFVAPIRHLNGEGYPVGRLTFEAEPGELVRVLGQDGGFRWGAALRVWRTQVDRDRVADVLALSPFEPTDSPVLHQVSRAAWIAADDLDALALWLSPLVDDETRDRLDKLGP